MILAAATLALLCQNPNADVQVVNAAEPKLSTAQLKESHAARATLVNVTVTAGGAVQTVSIRQSSGDQTVDAAAMNAARTSTYSPAKHNCTPIEGKYIFAVRVKPR